MASIPVLELHESAKLELGISIVNEIKERDTIEKITNNAPIFFIGSFEFLSIDFDVIGRGVQENAWMCTKCYGKEIIQHKCVGHAGDKKALSDNVLYLLYIASIVRDTCIDLGNFYTKNGVIARMKAVDEKDCITIDGFPEYVKLIVKKFECKPMLLIEVLEKAINEIQSTWK